MCLGKQAKTTTMCTSRRQCTCGHLVYFHTCRRSVYSLGSFFYSKETLTVISCLWKSSAEQESKLQVSWADFQYSIEEWNGYAEPFGIVFSAYKQNYNHLNYSIEAWSNSCKQEWVPLSPWSILHPWSGSHESPSHSKHPPSLSALGITLGARPQI